MKSQLNYKAKRNITIIVIIAILVVLASIGTYLFMKGNSETQAMSEVNGTSGDRAGEDYQVAQDNNDNQSENNNQENHNSEEENTDNDNETVENNNDNNDTDNDNDEDETVTVAENNSNANNTNNNNNTNNEQNIQTQTQTVTTTETVERTQRLVGFSTASIDYTGIGVNAEIPDLNSVAEAVTSVESNYVINGMEITYNVQLTSPETLSGINVSANIPEGTELVENSISDDGVVTDGKISWKVDVDTEKVVSFKVKVTATSGDISFVATVNGKDTNTVTNVVDEAPVMDVVAQNKYQMEVGTEYVEKGYSAIDKEDGDITDKVVLSYRFQAKDAPTWENPDPTELDTSRLGTYKITYTVTDSMGNTSKATRVVEIVDTQAPVIAGLDNGEYVNKNEIITITDAALDVVTINGVEQEFEGTEFQDKLTHEGTFVIVAIDKAGNKTEKTVTIDKTAPVIAGLDNGEYVNKNEIITIKDDNLETVTINGVEQEFEGTEFQDKLTHEGTFVIVAIDKAGNKTEKTVTIDKTAPTIAGLDNGEYVNKNEIVTIRDNNLETVTINGVEQEFEGTEFQDKLTHEGTFVIVAIDKAGNKTEKTVTIDKTAPVIGGLDDGEYVNRNEIVTIKDDNLETVTINGNEKEHNGKSYEVKLYEEGTYIIVAIDKAGNRTEKKVSIDKTPAVRSATNILVYGDNNENKEFYATIGDTIQAYISFNEKLAHNPTFILINDGKEYTMDASLVTAQEPNKDGKYVYQILYKIEENTTFVDGEITLRVTDLEDMYGNKIADETKPTNGHIVYFDKTAPMYTNLGILNVTHYRNNVKNNANEDINHIKDGDEIRILVRFEEKLAVEPKVMINNDKELVFDCTYRPNSSKEGSYYYYMADIKITPEMNLPEGEEIQFKVYGYEDAAGNVGDELDNSKINSIYYKKVIYDNQDPTSTFVRIQNNTPTAKSPDYAKVGDSVWVYVIFDEKLSVEPEFTISGESATIIQREDGEDKGQTWYKYAASITMTEDMEEGNIDFTISGYKDLAGNEGTEISGTTDGSAIKFDKTNPYLEVKNGTDNQGDKYTVGSEEDKKFSRISFKLHDNMALKEYVINGNVEQVTDKDGIKTSDANYNNIKKHLKENEENTIVLVDKAGNKSEEYTFYYDITAPVIEVNEKDTFEVGVDTYDYPETGSVTDNCDATRSLASAVHMHWYKVNADGTEIEVTPFKWGSTLADRELGKYHITYETSDKAGNTAKADRYVTLQDTTAPVIEVNEKDTFEIGVDTYDYPEDITVTDNRDGNMPVGDVNIIWYYATPEGEKGEVAYSENFPWNTNLKGVVEPGTTYYIEYWIEDAEGNRGEAHRLLTFEDNTAPKIKLNGETEIHLDTVEDAAKYVDAGATVTDNSDEDVEVKVQINWFEIVGDEKSEYNVSSVGANGEGRYNIVYTATDASGNNADVVQRLVYVGM